MQGAVKYSRVLGAKLEMYSVVLSIFEYCRRLFVIFLWSWLNVNIKWLGSVKTVLVFVAKSWFLAQLKAFSCAIPVSLLLFVGSSVGIDVVNKSVNDSKGESSPLAQ